MKHYAAKLIEAAANVYVAAYSITDLDPRIVSALTPEARRKQAEEAVHSFIGQIDFSVLDSDG